MRGYLMLLLLLFSVIGCGDGASTEPAAPANPDGLTAEQVENGIGPVTQITLSDTIDEALAKQGEEAFQTKCTACHKMEERYVGPALGDVLSHRKPEYVMNMMLNPDEMTKKHPEAKKLLAEFLTIMPNQNLQEDEARAILEFLRKQSTVAQ